MHTDTQTLGLLNKALKFTSLENILENMCAVILTVGRVYNEMNYGTLSKRLFDFSF